jgi:hypothetical protein
MNTKISIKFCAPGPDKTRDEPSAKLKYCAALSNGRSLADTKCYFRNVKSTLRIVQPSKCMDIGQHSFLTNEVKKLQYFGSLYIFDLGEMKVA